MVEPPEPSGGPVRRARRALARLLQLPAEQQPRFEELRALADRNHHVADLALSLAQRLEEGQRALADTAARIEGRLVTVESAVSPPTREAAQAVASLALTVAGIDPPPPRDDVFISIAMPTWQRAAYVGEAIRSIQLQTHRNWELIVADDGSDDGTAEVVAPFLADERIRYEWAEWSGECPTRNRALARCQGPIIAFLDSDNSWHPTHLARHVAALEATGARWSMSGQVIVDGRTGELRLRDDRRSLDTLGESNFIDTNVLAVRRDALDEVGGFDESLRRLGDWDLVARLARLGPPARTDATTSLYRTDPANRVERLEPVQVTAHMLRRRYRGRPAAGLRVLMAEWHFPQITETSIAAVVSGLLENGAEVAAWSETDVSVEAATPVEVLRGDLADAIAMWRPDVVVTHQADVGERLGPVVEAAGVLHAVGTPTCFDDARFGPSGGKDTRLVLRTSAGLLTNDLDTFFLAAAACPDHRFVLVLGHALEVEGDVEALVARGEELGSPCEVLVDVPHHEVAALVAKAGIYLHTHGTEHAVTMPISIAEAMATGAWVLGRDLPGMAAYLGEGGTLYTGDTVAERVDAASALIRGSLEWGPRRWEQVALRATESAFERFASSDVVAGMVRAWADRGIVARPVR